SRCCAEESGYSAELARRGMAVFSSAWNPSCPSRFANRANRRCDRSPGLVVVSLTGILQNLSVPIQFLVQCVLSHVFDFAQYFGCLFNQTRPSFIFDQ